MSLRERAGLAALGAVGPEAAHGLALRALRAGLGPRIATPTSARLAVTLAGLALPNPVGLAAGFDKNATAIAPLLRAGFGFIEVGAATPLPQPGNPPPRLFRLAEDRAAINRFGFNNDGAGPIAARLAARRDRGVVGLNLGANKASPDRAADFAEVLAQAGPFVDFATVNVSSPNTERLRDLQGRAALAAVLDSVLGANAALARPVPIFLKISPDLADAGLADLADVALSRGIAGLIATNTTLDRAGLRSLRASEPGGLSGAPLFERSTRATAKLFVMTEGALPIVGVGGVASPEDAYEKIRAGATAVQLYTALVYQGLGLVPALAHGLDRLLERDGFDTVSQAVGSGVRDWLT